MEWAYGVTTVPERLSTTLPLTLASLAAAGFDRPRLFVDGATNGFDGFGLDVSYRSPRVRAFGNWYLAAVELVCRYPGLNRYALFQDDLVAVRNLRAYLDRIIWNGKRYLNLYTWPDNEALANGRQGWYESNQLGKGAVALVFNREALLALLCTPQFTTWPCHPHRGHRKIDGTIAKALGACGFKELVHSPSLTMHTGKTSVMGNLPQKGSASFPGEQFDALALIV